MTDERATKLTQVIIAAVIIGGWVFGLVAKIPEARELTPFATLVIGYYFGVVVPTPAKTSGGGTGTSVESESVTVEKRTTGGGGGGNVAGISKKKALTIGIGKGAAGGGAFANLYQWLVWRGVL
jgi:hypothetical protein